MTLQYCTVDEIQLLLDYRLESIGVPTQNGGTFGAKKVRPELIQMEGEGVEANIDATLRLIYVLPIDPLNTIAHRILRSISTKLIVAEIFRVHYQMAMTATLGGDAGYGSVQLNEGVKELERYTAGYGIYYSSQGNSGNVPRNGSQNQQCVPLPGVPLKPTHDVVRTLQPFSAVAVDRVVGKTKINWGV